MNTTTMKERVVSLLSEVNRKGIDNLIQFVKDSNYLTTAQCRSICILKECGVELTSDERSAIFNHHPRGFGKWVSTALKSPLQLLLQMGDCRSTGLNKRGKAYRFSSI